MKKINAYFVNKNIDLDKIKIDDIIVTDNFELYNNLQNESKIKLYNFNDFLTDNDLSEIEEYRDFILYKMFDEVNVYDKSIIFAVRLEIESNLVKILKTIKSLDNFILQYNLKNVIINDTDIISKTVYAYFKQNNKVNIVDKSSKIDIIKAIFHEKKNKWSGTNFRIFFLQNLFDLLQIIYAQFHKKPDNYIKNKNLLFLEAKIWAIPLYKKFHNLYNIIFFTNSYPGWKIFKKEKKPFIESFFNLSDLLKYLKFKSLYKRKWKEYQNVMSENKLFFYRNINIFNLLKDNIKNIFLISFPKLSLYSFVYKRLFKKINKSSLILSFGDYSPSNRVLVTSAKINSKISSMYIQHGLMVEDYPKDIFVDKIFAWGVNTIEWFKQKTKNNKLEDKFIVGGCPFFEDKSLLKSNIDILKNLKLNKNNLTIVIGTVKYESFSPRHTHFNNFYMIKETINAIKTFAQNFNIIIKIHPGETKEFYKTFIQKQDIDICIVNEYNIDQVLPCADMYISWYSTSVLEAMMMQKPCLVFDKYTKKELIEYHSKAGVYFADNKDNIIKFISDVMNKKYSFANYKSFIEKTIIKTGNESMQILENKIKEYLYVNE